MDYLPPMTASASDSSAPGAAVEAPAQTPILLPMAAEPPSGPAELVQGLLPLHQVSVLAGASGAGKTTLALQALKSCLEGQPCFGLSPSPVLAQPGAIGYVVADRTKEDLRLTAQAVGLDLSRLKVRSLVDDPSIDISKFEAVPTTVLFDLLKSLLPVTLVVVDPLIVFTGVDTNKYHLNAAKLIRMNRFCMDNHITVLGTHHATKARTDYGFKRAQDRISGSSALLGYTSTQLFLSTPEENDSEFFEWTIVSHHAAPRTLQLTRTNSGFTVAGEKGGTAGKTAVPLEDLLVSILKVGPATSGSLVHSSGASRSAVYRCLAEMERIGIICRTERGIYRLAAIGAEVLES